MAVKNQALTTQLKEDLRELAYRRRTSMGGMIRTIIDEYAEGVVEAGGVPAERFDAEIKYNAPASYDKAMERATIAGLPLSEVVRNEIARRADETLRRVAL